MFWCPSVVPWFQLLGDWLEDSGWTNALVQADICKLWNSWFLHTSKPCYQYSPCSPGHSCKLVHTASPNIQWRLQAQWCWYHATFWGVVYKDSQGKCALKLLAEDPVTGASPAVVHQIHSWRELSALCGISDTDHALDVCFRSHELLQVAFCTHPWHDDPQWQAPRCPGRIGNFVVHKTSNKFSAMATIVLVEEWQYQCKWPSTNDSTGQMNKNVHI